MSFETSNNPADENDAEELLKQINEGSELINELFKEFRQIQSEIESQKEKYSDMTQAEIVEFKTPRLIRVKEILGSISRKIAEQKSAMREVDAKTGEKDKQPDTDWGSELEIPESVNLDDAVIKDINRRIATVKEQIQSGKIDDLEALNKEIESINSFIADLKKQQDGSSAI